MSRIKERERIICDVCGGDMDERYIECDYEEQRIYVKAYQKRWHFYRSVIEELDVCPVCWHELKKMMKEKEKEKENA